MFGRKAMVEVDARIVQWLLEAQASNLGRFERMARTAALLGCAYRTTARPIRVLAWVVVAALVRALIGT